MPTSQFFPDANPETNTVDGFVARNVAGQTWASMRDAVIGTGVSDSGFGCQVYVIADTTTNNWVGFGRGILLFDTSPLNLAGITITAAVLRFYVDTLIDDFGMDLDAVGVTPASNTSLALGDYAQFATTLLGTVSLAGITASAYNTLTLNSTGRAAIQTAGITKFGLRLSADRTNTEPTWSSGATSEVIFFTAEFTAGFRPYLEVTYTLPANTLDAEGLSGVAGRSQATMIIHAQTQAASQSAERSRVGSQAAAGTRGRSDSAAIGVFAVATSTQQVIGRSDVATQTRASNLTMAGARAYSRDAVETNMVTYARAFQFGRSVAAAESAAQPVSIAAVNAKSVTPAFSGGEGSIIVAGSLAAIGYPYAAASSGAFGVVMTPLVARGSDRVASRSSVSAAKSIAGPSALSEARGRSTGREKVIAEAEAGDVASERTRGKIASSAPIEGSDFRTSTSRGVTRVTAGATGARSFTLRYSLAISRIVVTALGLARSTGRDSGTYRVIVGTPGYSVLPERDGATLTVSTAAINGRSITPARDRQTTLAACFVVGASVTQSHDKSGFYNVVALVAARPFTIASDSAGTRSAVFVAGRSSAPARASGSTVSLALTVGLSISPTRDRFSQPLSVAAVVVGDRVAVESSGRMIGTVDLHASDAARASSTLLTVNAIAGFIVAEIERVVIN